MLKYLFVIFVSLFISVVFWKAWWQWDIQGYLYTEYEKSLSDDSFSKLAKDKWFLDIYKFVYSNLKNKQILIYKDAVEIIFDILSKKNCSVTKNELRILLSAIYFWNFSKVYWKKAKVDENKISDICSKIIICTSPEADINIDNCRRILAIYLNFYVFSQNLLSNMKLATNEWDDILLNWDPSDGPYDLLKDIEEIKKILFQQKSFKKAWSINFYKSERDNSKSEIEVDTPDWKETSSISSLNNFNPPDVWNSNGDSYSMPPDIMVRDTESNNFEVEKISNENKWDIKNVNNKIVNNTECLKNSDGNDEFNKLLSNLRDEEGARNIENKDFSENFQENQIDSIDPYKSNPLDYTFWNESGDRFNDDFINDLNAIYNNGSLWKDLTSLWWWKTICWNFSKWGMVWVNICFIPSWVKVPPKDRVYSIEDILNQLLRILTLLKDSGQLTKHAYTDEFWETRLQDIKLSRIFVFDIVILKKKLFPEKYTHKEDKEKEIEKEKQEYKDIQNLLWIAYSDNIQNDKWEKNKYVVLGNSKKLFWEYKYRWWNNNVLHALSEEENIWNIQKIFYEFLEANLENWKQIDLLLMQARKTALYFYQEILKGINK